MNKSLNPRPTGLLTRRTFLHSATVAAIGMSAGTMAASPIVKGSSIASLKEASLASNKILGVYTVQHQLLNDPKAAGMIEDGFALIADGNDLKFSNRLRPTPDTFNFAPGDIAVNWAQQHNKLFRGHCLVWWNALPSWFTTYVTPKNARQVMEKHIHTVVGHYAGRIYSWDVVNEPIYHDGRLDGLRYKPWVQLLGPEYIDIAFHMAAAADSKAHRVLNECYIEHATPQEVTRRSQLLALMTRLVKSQVPVTAVGIQGHLRGNTPLDGPGLTQFMRQIQDLGLDIMITELDVDDYGVSESRVSQTVADKYSQFLDIISPFVRVITFEALEDDPAAPHVHDLFTREMNASGSAYKPAQAFASAMAAIQRKRTSL